MGLSATGRGTGDSTRGTIAVALAGLPVEEIAFFVVVPLASVLTFEAVKVARRKSVPDAP